MNKKIIFQLSETDFQDDWLCSHGKYMPSPVPITLHDSLPRHKAPFEYIAQKVNKYWIPDLSPLVCCYSRDQQVSQQNNCQSGAQTSSNTTKY
ncbi:hypothetical protein Peur_032130 [Populus x canadensis]